MSDKDCSDENMSTCYVKEILEGDLYHKSLTRKRKRGRRKGR